MNSDKVVHEERILLTKPLLLRTVSPINCNIRKTIIAVAMMITVDCWQNTCTEN